MPLSEELQDYILEHGLTTDPSVIFMKAASLLDDVLVCQTIEEEDDGGYSDPMLTAAAVVGRSIESKSPPWEENWRITPMQFNELKQAREFAWGKPSSKGKAGKDGNHQSSQAGIFEDSDWYDYGPYKPPFDLEPDIYVLPRSMINTTKGNAAQLTTAFREHLQLPADLGQDLVCQLEHEDPPCCPTLSDVLRLHWIPDAEQKEALKIMMQTFKNIRQANVDSPLRIVDEDVVAFPSSPPNSPKPISPPLRPRAEAQRFQKQAQQSPHSDMRTLLKDIGLEVIPSSQEPLDMEEWNRIDGGLEFIEMPPLPSYSDLKPSSPPNLMPSSSSDPGLVGGQSEIEIPLVTRRPMKRSHKMAFEDPLAIFRLESFQGPDLEVFPHHEATPDQELRNLLECAAPSLMDLVGATPVLEPPPELFYLPKALPSPSLAAVRADRAAFACLPCSAFAAQGPRIDRSPWSTTKVEGLKGLNIELSWTPITFRQSMSLEDIVGVSVTPVLAQQSTIRQKRPDGDSDHQDCPDAESSVIALRTRRDSDEASDGSESICIVDLQIDNAQGMLFRSDSDMEPSEFHPSNSTRALSLGQFGSPEEPSESPNLCFQYRSAHAREIAVPVHSDAADMGMTVQDPALDVEMDVFDDDLSPRTVMSRFQPQALSPIMETGDSSSMDNDLASPPPISLAGAAGESASKLQPWKTFPSSESDQVLLVNDNPRHNSPCFGPVQEFSTYSEAEAEGVVDEQTSSLDDLLFEPRTYTESTEGSSSAHLSSPFDAAPGQPFCLTKPRLRPDVDLKQQSPISYNIPLPLHQHPHDRLEKTAQIDAAPLANGTASLGSGDADSQSAALPQAHAIVPRRQDVFGSLGRFAATHWGSNREAPAHRQSISAYSAEKPAQKQGTPIPAHESTTDAPEIIVPPPPESIPGLYRLRSAWRMPPVSSLVQASCSLRLLQNRPLHQQLSSFTTLVDYDWTSTPNFSTEGPITLPDLAVDQRAAVIFLCLNKLPRAVIRHEELEAVDKDEAFNSELQEACFTSIYRLVQTYQSLFVVFEAYSAAETKASVVPYPYTPPITQALATLRDAIDQYVSFLADDGIDLRCDVGIAESVEMAAALAFQWLVDAHQQTE